MTFKMRAGLAFTAVLALGCSGDDAGGDSTTGPASSDGTTMGVGAESDSSVESDSEGGPEGSSGNADSTGPGGGSSSDGAGSSSDGGSSSGTSGAAGPTWDNFAAGFFETYCWECHGPGDAEGRDYSLLADVIEEANTIRCGTGPASDPPPDCGGEPPAEQFPIGANLPTSKERATLVEWIDAGTPEN